MITSGRCPEEEEENSLLLLWDLSFDCPVREGHTSTTLRFGRVRCYNRQDFLLFSRGRSSWCFKSNINWSRKWREEGGKQCVRHSFPKSFSCFVHLFISSFPVLLYILLMIMILVPKISSSSRRENRHHRPNLWNKTQTLSLHPVCNFKVSHQVFFFCTFSTSKMKEGNGYVFVERLCVYYVCAVQMNCRLEYNLNDREKEGGRVYQSQVEWEKSQGRQQERGWVCEVSSSSSSSCNNKMRDTRNFWWYIRKSIIPLDDNLFYLLLCPIISYFFSNLLLFLSSIRGLLLKQWLLIAHSLQLLRNCLQSNLLLYYIRLLLLSSSSRLPVSFTLFNEKRLQNEKLQVLPHFLLLLFLFFPSLDFVGLLD